MSVPMGRSFLPHRLNRHPVVVRGLTADELWICCGLSGAAACWSARRCPGCSAPLPSRRPSLSWAWPGRVHRRRHLRRLKRGRPDTWLYRQLQWRIAARHPLMAGWVGGHVLISRSGFWTTRRAARGARDEPFQERDHPPAGAHQTLAPGRWCAGHRRPGHGRRLVERAARPDHPRPARPALWQYPQVVGSAAEIGLCVHVLRVPDPQPLADEWRRRLPRNLHTLSPYLTPSCPGFLRADYDYRRSTGELRQRVRGIYEIPGRSYGDDPTARVRVVSDRDWVVTLDITADEYYGAEQVKRALVRYP